MLFNDDTPDTCDDPERLREASSVLSKLAAYCEHRAGQLTYAAKGDTEAAEACRKAAQAQHDRLPADYRWK